MKMFKRKIIDNIIFIIAVLSILGFLFPKLLSNLNFGLDLKGGFEVLYQVKEIDGSKPSNEMLTSTYVTMVKRIDVLGVTEPVITVEGDDKIRIQLAGITDSKEARETLSQAATLSFRDTKDNLIMSSSVLKSAGARLSTDAYGKPAVALSIKNKDAFYKATKAISESNDNRIVIWLDFKENVDSFETEQANCGSLTDSKCLSVASVSEGFSSDVIIQGNFETKEVTNLVELINSGSLPTILEEVSSKNVAASFGKDSLNKTFIAGIVGIVGILVLMMVIYKFAGLISAFGILIYTFLTIFTFWLLGGVLTLSGIAALVIGIGMAVDASVITYARIKEELQKGIPLKEAFRLGNKGAFSSIIDANLTTLITAVIMFLYGQSSIKGYATMLIISVIITMLIMVSLIRILLTRFIDSGYFDKKLYLFVGFKKGKKEPKIFNRDYVKSRSKYYILTSVFVIIGALFLTFKGFNLGVDFSGGTNISIKSNNVLKIKDIEKDIKKLNYKLVNIDKINDNNFSINLKEDLNKEESLKLDKHFSENYDASTDIGVVSNIVRIELIKNAIISVLLSSIGIIIYVTIRFNFSYAIGAIISLLHDAFIVMAVFSIFQLEVSAILVAAILSILGYSINDTIVTFDRIKENMKKEKNIDENILKNIVNVSLKQTIVRSLITSITAFIPILALLLFGSHEIVNFNLALFIGMIAGVYSSIFIAAQLWFDIEKRKLKKVKKKTKVKKTKKEVEELKVKGINS